MPEMQVVQVEKNPRVLHRELFATSAGMMLVSALALSGLTYTLWMFSKDIAHGQLALAVDHTLFLAVAMLLSYGICTYLCARRGYLSRVLTFKAASNKDLGSSRTKQEMPTVTVLIPSYQEELHVMRKTLISAALQDYPRRRVVLLIDNPPDSPLASERRKLDAARQLPTEVAQLFARPRRDCLRAMERFLQRTTQAPLNGMDECQNLAHLCRVIASWYEEQAHAHPQLEYSDPFFADMTFKQPAARLRDDAAHWDRRAHTATAHQDHELFAREYRRLLNLFSVEITSFERKRYLNLSHYPNKASNLNSYIALLGGSYRETPTPTGVLLTPISPDHADFTVPAAEFILMLDADTLIAPEYTMRLVNFLCQPGHEPIAVVQSPYSTFPRPPHTLQRIAGAQTDIQYLLHQGLTYYDATYWVGANAVVRTAALNTIMTLAEERGFKVKKFIQDHTLIEDTESSIDLICRGWKLFNYPQRLAFSATPPDFGSLLIQRRRWANGGLLVLPKLWRYVQSTAVTPGVIMEVFMRAQYLLSLGPVSLAFLVVVVFAVGQALWINWMVVTALIYYAFYLRDLRLNGYGWADLFRVFALNILLIPVNLCGLGLSAYQACSGYKAQFGRTPKATDRTPVPAGYLIAELAVLLTLFVLAGRDFYYGHHLHGSFLLAHAAALLYAIAAFLGFRDAFQDLATLWHR